MAECCDLELFHRRWLQWDYFRMGMMWTAYVPPDELWQYPDPEPTLPLPRKLMNTVITVGEFGEVVRVRSLGPSPIGPLPDLVTFRRPEAALREWHEFGGQLMSWLCATQMKLDLWRMSNPSAVTSPVTNFRDFGQIDLPPLDLVLQSTTAVAALEPEGVGRASPTIRRLDRAATLLRSGASPDNVWNEVTLTYTDRPSGWSVNFDRFAVMCHVYEVIHRDINHLALGRTPTPYWDRNAGKVFLHQREVAKIRLASAPRALEILNAFELQNWPPKVSVDDAMGRSAIHQTVSTLNNKLKGKGLSFHVVDHHHVRWEITI